MYGKRASRRVAANLVCDLATRPPGLRQVLPRSELPSPPRRSHVRARTMNAAAASVADLPTFPVFHRHVPAALAEHVAVCVSRQHGQAPTRARPIASSRARRSSATRARRCTSTAPSRSPSPSDAFDTNFYMWLQCRVRSPTAPPHPTGRRRMRIFCAPARCRRPHASRTTFFPPASAPSLPSRPPVCRVCWSHGAASRRRLQPRAAPSGLERAAAFASPSLGECRAFSARLRLRRYGLPTASFWRSQQLTAPGTRAERAHHSRGGSGGRARSVSPR